VIKLGTQGLNLNTRKINKNEISILKNNQAWYYRQILAPCFDLEVEVTTGSGDATFARF